MKTGGSPSQKPPTRQANHPPRPEQLGTGKQPLTKPLKLYSKDGLVDQRQAEDIQDNYDSIANSIALDCHTHFVSIDKIDESQMVRIAKEAYNKVMSAYSKPTEMKRSDSRKQPSVAATTSFDQQALFEGVEKIVKQYETQQRIKSASSSGKRQPSACWPAPLQIMWLRSILARGAAIA